MIAIVLLASLITGVKMYLVEMYGNQHDDG
jgi:hypothetical protein